MADHRLRAVEPGEGDEPPVLTCHERARMWLERAEAEMAGEPPRLGYVDVLAHIAHAWATLALTEPLPVPEPTSASIGQWLDEQTRPGGQA